MKRLIPILGLMAGLAAGLLFVWYSGESPVHVLSVLFHSSFGSKYDFGQTLFYTAPLIFTGLSVCLAFHAGLFNVGAEGQLSLGALACALTGIWLPDLPFPLAPLIAVFIGALIGGFWGFIPGWLRVHRGSHEVINTIMLNFVAAGLVAWVTLYLVPNPDSQNPETSAIGAGYVLTSRDPVSAYFVDTPASSAILLAIACAVGLWFFLYRTTPGYELRASGQNEEAARIAGIPVDRLRTSAMFGAGALASLVSVCEILGNSGRYKLGFSPDYGFLGIAVALLARDNPLMILLTAFLFGILHKGSASLDLETEKVTREFSYILQALIILFVSARAFPRRKS